MERHTQLLVLEPPDCLVFSGENDYSAGLELTNPTPYAICFKVKTTASRKYVVRPKSGLILPYSRRQVTFWPREGYPSEDDRFKIVSAVKPQESRGTDPAQIWAYVQESEVMASRLKVRAVPVGPSPAKSSRFLRWPAFLVMSALAVALGAAALLLPQELWTLPDLPF